MKRILVAGGGGKLGSRIVEELQRRGQAARVMSRRPAPPGSEGILERVRADVATGEGLAASLKGSACSSTA
jgi:uncharacterized protein YbjT (DUF2867 family)